jgi:superfamily II DNA helicase RecQ
MEAADFIVASPERVVLSDFREALKGNLGRQIAYLVIDEVHCVSEW